MPIISEYNLSGQVAALATSGGHEAVFLAQGLAEAGATVFAIARRQDTVDEVLSTLGPGGHGGVAAHAATPDGVAQVVQAFDRAHDRVDVLVNDARCMLAKPFSDISLAEWDELYTRNVRATFLLCQQFGQRMIQRQYGRIVNVVSELAERGMINGSAFSATQSALLSLTRSLGVEWGRHNIRVNALGTGWFTPEDIPPEQQQEELLVRYTPLRRKGHPRDIVPLLVYLCSQACDYTTGQPVYVDGGLNAHP